MKVTERRVLWGPNIYAARPVYFAVLDLEAMDGVASTALPGFNDALLAAVPTLSEHRCSPGHVGGFVERLRGGTYMAHVVEHLALELQCLAGLEVGFGRARKVAGRPRHYRVVFACLTEPVAEAALNLAMEVVATLAAAKPARLDAGLAHLRHLVRAAALGPSTRAIVEAAARRGIPTRRLTEHASVFQLGWGAKQQRIQATMTSQTNHIAVGMASDKDLTKRLLAEAGLPVPKGRTVSTLEAAQAAALHANGPVAMKPLCGNHGRGVTTAVSGPDAVEAAFGRAQQFGRSVIVEQQISGDDYRVLVVGQAVVAASRRVPPEVTGDGQSTIRQLVEAINADPRRGDGHENVLTKVRLDEAAAKELARHGFDADAVPAAGTVVRLRGNANLSTGGTAQDVTAELHPDTALACVRAARKIGLDIAGIDLVCRDIAQPLSIQGGAIIEVNAAPGIRMHEHPSVGKRRRAGRAIVDSLFPATDDGRVPVIAVTGSDGMTTTTRSIAHALQHMGHLTGVATAEGITVAGRRVEDGDCTGYGSAQTVLASPEVAFAVLETSSAGMLGCGLGFDQCDVGVVLNAHDTHPGQGGPEAKKDLARVKGLVVATARKAVVLNADDALCVRLARQARRGTEVIYFGLDATRPALAGHLASGGRAVYAHHGVLTWADGERRLPLMRMPPAPTTLHDPDRHDIAAAMATFAALLALAMPKERIATGLTSFSFGEGASAWRPSVHRMRGVTLLLDPAQDATAYEALIARSRPLANGRLIGIVTAPSDGHAANLIAAGQVCGAGFDGLVICETDGPRHHPAGEAAEWMARGARAARQTAPPSPEGPRRVRTAIDLRAALCAALAGAVPGDFIVVACDNAESALRAALDSMDLSACDGIAHRATVDAKAHPRPVACDTLSTVNPADP